MVRIEVRDLFSGTRPEQHVVLGVAEVVGEAATEVACTEHAGPDFLLWRLWGARHSEDGLFVGGECHFEKWGIGRELLMISSFWGKR